MKEKTHTIIAIVAEKAFDTVQHSFVISMEETYLNTIKALYEKHTVDVIINRRKLKAFPLRSGTRQG